MTRVRLLVLVLSALLPGVANATVCPPNVRAGHSVDYYEVSGDSYEALESSLDRSPLSGSNGVLAYALTEWCVRWVYVPWRRSHGCELAHITVILNSKITLPKWVAPKHISSDLRGWWEAFINAAESHENQHLENARATRSAIDEALRRLEPAPTCGAALREADRTARNVYWEFLAKDQKFDRDTGYGRKDIEAALSNR